MPPKGKGSKSKGKSQGVVIDGVNTSEMTREQLEVFALRLKEELEREREERNFFQLERDKLRIFWEITRQQLEDAKAQILVKDREIEAVGERNDEDTKNFRQKIKHIYYEHEHKIRMIQAQSMMAIHQCETDHRCQEFTLLGDKIEFKKLLQSCEKNQVEQKKCLKLEFAKAHYQARRKFEDYSRQIEIKFEDYYDDLREDVYRTYQMEREELEERKNRQLSNLIRDNDFHVYKIQDLFDCIAMNNYLILSKMQINAEEVAAENHLLRMKMAEIGSVNKTVVGPLKECREERNRLQKMVKKFQKESRKYQNTRNRLKALEQERDNMKWVKIVQELERARIKNERDILYKKLFEGNLVMNQRSLLQHMLHEKKVEVLTQQIESREAAIEDLTSDQPQPQGFLKKHEGIISKKNATIRDLETQIAVAIKSYDGIVRAYKADCQKRNLALNISKFDLRKLRRPEPLKLALALPTGPITTKDLPVVFDSSIGAELAKQLIPRTPISQYTWGPRENPYCEGTGTRSRGFVRKIVQQPEVEEQFTYDPDVSDRH